MKKIIVYIIFLVLFLLNTTDVHATLYINEIFPSPSDSGQEWVEIYNDSDQPVDLSGFTLKEENGTALTLTQQVIPPKGLVIATSASGLLKNSGELITLYDNQYNSLDHIAYPSIQTNYSFIRCPDGSQTWIKTSTSSQKTTNNTSCIPSSPTPSSTPTITPSDISPIPTDQLSPTATLAITQTLPTPYSSVTNIYISEVMAYPESNEAEWIELFNANDFEVLLQNWYIDDTENIGSSPKSFSITIPAKSFVTVDLTTSMFNNDGDSVRLLNQQKTIINSLEYTVSEKGKTWGKQILEEDTLCIQLPSKGSINNSCLIATATPAPTASKNNPTKTPTPTKTITKLIASNDIQNNRPKKSKQLSNNFYKPITQKKRIEFQDDDNLETVLGTSYRIITHPYTNMIKTLSFASFSYGLLATTSLLYKIMYRIKKGE